MKATGENLNKALLVVYGDLETYNNTFKADLIFERLRASSLWFTARVPKDTKPGIPILFYQVAHGVRGTATLVAFEKVVAKTGSRDRGYIPGMPMDMFPWRLDLADFDTFDQPIDLRPILEDLSFVTNKIYWGHSLRFSPRLISLADYKLIIGSHKSTRALATT